MNYSEFARFFVRFNGAVIAFWALHGLIDLPPYIRNYAIVHEVPGADALAARDLWTFVLKTAVQLLAALVLLVKAEGVVQLFSKGEWPKRPNKSPEPTTTAVTPRATETETK